MNVAVFVGQTKEVGGRAPLELSLVEISTEDLLIHKQIHVALAPLLTRFIVCVQSSKVTCCETYLKSC